MSSVLRTLLTLVLGLVLGTHALNAAADDCAGIGDRVAKAVHDQALKSDGPKIRPGDVLDLSDTPKILSKGALNRTEDFYNTPTQTIVMWSKGPQAGKVFRVFDRPSEKQLKAVPSVQQINAELDRRFKEMIPMKRAGPEQAKAVADMVVYLNKVYDGTATQPGLKVAQYYSPEHAAFVKEFNQQGWQKFVEERAWAAGLPQSRGMETGFAAIHGSQVTDAAMRAYHYLPTPQVLPDDIVLTHGTYDNAISSIINGRGLYSGETRPAGLAQVTGEYSNTSSLTPYAVSFWSTPEGARKVEGGFGPYMKTFDKPIAFGIRRSTSNALRVSSGGMKGEAEVKDNVPIENLDYLFVPKSEIEMYKDLLEAHGLGRIEVLPLSMPPEIPK